MTVDVKVAKLLGYFGQGSSPNRSGIRNGACGHPVVGLNWVAGKPHGDLMPGAEDVILVMERGTLNPTGDPPQPPDEPNIGIRPAYARLKEEQQRVAGGGRWSVDGSRRCCHGCQQEIVRGTPFWTVLRPAEEEPTEPEAVAAFFSRQDHCESCIESLEDGQHYARWKTSVPAPDEPPRRIVNIASLHATFLSLLEVESTPSTSESTPEEDAEGDPQPPAQATEPNLPAAAGLPISQQADRERLAYLLALFLVRKRALQWLEHQGDHLLVKERCGNLHRVTVPRIDSRVLDEAVYEFEQLFS